VYCTLAEGTVISAQMASSAAKAVAPGASVTVGLQRGTGVLVAPA
jgi:putative spermidine/putrescine transport system ATP-binding protein